MATLTINEVRTIIDKNLFPGMIIVLDGPGNRNFFGAASKSKGIGGFYLRDSSGKIYCALIDKIHVFDMVNKFSSGGGRGFEDGKFYSSSPADQAELEELNKHVINFYVTDSKESLRDDLPQTQTEYYNPMPENQPLPAHMPRGNR